jgi:hypothetical protein
LTDGRDFSCEEPAGAAGIGYQLEAMHGTQHVRPWRQPHHSIFGPFDADEVTDSERRIQACLIGDHEVREWWRRASIQALHLLPTIGGGRIADA